MNTEARVESPVPSALLIGSSRNSLMSAAGSGDSSCVSKSGMFYRNSTDIIGPCCCEHQETPDSSVRFSPTRYNPPSLTVSDDNFEFDGPLKQLYLQFDKLCRACGATKLTSDFYVIRDYAKLGMTSYPSARCKPCHNSRTAENQRARRAFQKNFRESVSPSTPGSRPPAGMFDFTLGGGLAPQGGRGAEVKTVAAPSRKS